MSGVYPKDRQKQWRLCESVCDEGGQFVQVIYKSPLRKGGTQKKEGMEGSEKLKERGPAQKSSKSAVFIRLCAARRCSLAALHQTQKTLLSADLA